MKLLSDVVVCDYVGVVNVSLTNCDEDRPEEVGCNNECISDCVCEHDYSCCNEKWSGSCVVNEEIDIFGCLERCQEKPACNMNSHCVNVDDISGDVSYCECNEGLGGVGCQAGMEECHTISYVHFVALCSTPATTEEDILQSTCVMDTYEPGCNNSCIESCICEPDHDDYCCLEWDELCVYEVLDDDFGCVTRCAEMNLTCLYGGTCHMDGSLSYCECPDDISGFQCATGAE